jgi:hypothetical protein
MSRLATHLAAVDIAMLAALTILAATTPASSPRSERSGSPADR